MYTFYCATMTSPVDAGVFGSSRMSLANEKSFEWSVLRLENVLPTFAFLNMPMRCLSVSSCRVEIACLVKRGQKFDGLCSLRMFFTMDLHILVKGARGSTVGLLGASFVFFVTVFLVVAVTSAEPILVRLSLYVGYSRPLRVTWIELFKK